MRSKAQDAYKTALSPRLLRFQTGRGYVAFATMRNRLFFDEGYLKTTPPTTFFLNELYRLMMWSLTHFDDTIDKRLSLIVRVNVVLNRTVVVDSD